MCVSNHRSLVVRSGTGRREEMDDPRHVLMLVVVLRKQEAPLLAQVRVKRARQGQGQGA